MHFNGTFSFLFILAFSQSLTNSNREIVGKNGAERIYRRRILLNLIFEY